MVKVTVVEGRQVVTDDGEHHFGGDELEVPEQLADEWIRAGWAVEAAGRESGQARSRRSRRAR
jgi:hypothetical protein